MSVSTYADIGEALSALQIRYTQSANVITPAAVKVPMALVEDILYTLDKLPYKTSEAAIGEMILFPILKAVFKDFDEHLALWSHKSLKVGKKSMGIPDYLIAKRSALGKVVLEKPLLAVVEAKKDDFEGGWAQCLLEMHTMQQLNNLPDVAVYGIVSNGDYWDFGCLQKDHFIHQNAYIPLLPLDNLYAHLYAILQACQAAVKDID